MAEPPIPICVLTREQLLPAEFTARSLAEAVALEPQGVYTVARTFRGDHALLLDAHLDRLEQSAHLVGIPVNLDRARLREGLRTILHQAGFPDAKFRITIPRDDPDSVYLSLEQYHPVPEEIQREGAHVITVPLVRQNPVVKTTDWMTIRRPAYDSLPPTVYEGILVHEDGRLLEGMSSNFYGVLEGVLHTAGEGVLEGITRRAILEIAPAVISLKLVAVRRADVPRLTEAFLTSSGRGLVPITFIDGDPVGEGIVGPVAADMRRRYDAWTETMIEPI
jgi:branched-chain amino acid aminotransferase